MGSGGLGNCHIRKTLGFNELSPVNSLALGGLCIVLFRSELPSLSNV